MPFVGKICYVFMNSHSMILFTKTKLKDRNYYILQIQLVLFIYLNILSITLK
jgi:hypothetical protein